MAEIIPFEQLSEVIYLIILYFFYCKRIQ